MKMVYTICYALIFLAEILISLFYFENKFERRISKKFLIISFMAAYVILYFARLINITVVNMIVFFVCNFFLLYRCYKAKIKSAIFHCSILLVFNVTTEFVVMLFSAAILGTELLACLDNSVNLIFQSTISKLLYFFSMYILYFMINFKRFFIPFKCFWIIVCFIKGISNACNKIIIIHFFFS